MDNIQSAKIFLKELEAEATATRKCLERIPMELSDWKPHEKSMTLGYLTLLVADIPRWITYIIEKGEIDLTAYEQFKPQTTEELVKHFDKVLTGAKNALKNVPQETLSKNFFLKNQGQVLFTSPVDEIIGSTLNHWVHHRGQLTVYMRLNNIPVPSIYGPSADDRTY